jgi:hypothetical protein
VGVGVVLGTGVVVEVGMEVIVGALIGVLVRVGDGDEAKAAASVAVGVGRAALQADTDRPNIRKAHITPSRAFIEINSPLSVDASRTKLRS